MMRKLAPNTKTATVRISVSGGMHGPPSAFQEVLAGFEAALSATSDCDGSLRAPACARKRREAAQANQPTASRPKRSGMPAVNGTPAAFGGDDRGEGIDQGGAEGRPMPAPSMMIATPVSAVISRGDHDGDNQGVEGERFLRHAVDGAARGEERHQQRDHSISPAPSSGP